MREVFKQVRSRITPPQWASWQTLIFLSVFSALVASLTSVQSPQIAQRIISSFGWLFLILGVWWFTYEDGVKKKLTFFQFFIGPWIVGALICIYLFGTIEGRIIPTQAAFISWPPISAIIWSTPKFVTSDSKTRNPVYSHPSVERRQQIVLVMLANLIFSCWFQFYFQVGDWLAQNPGLQRNDFSRSAFVWRPQRVDRAAAITRGVEMLEVAAKTLEGQLEGKAWSDIERWLERLDEQVPNFRRQVQDRVEPTFESNLWDLNVPPPTQVGDGAYDLPIQAVWTGPTSRTNGFRLMRTCRISQGRKMGPAQFKFDSPAPPARAKQVRPRFIGIVNCGSIREGDANGMSLSPPS
jgi:hypothetical protein